MIPLMLKFKGFFNYEDEAVVDFEYLNESKLFGIFGKTGSGKSTILNAVSYALFDKIDRLGSSGDEYINTNTKEGYVELTFSILNDNKEYEKYRVYRDFRIKQNKKGEFETKKKAILLDGDGNVLCDKVKQVSKEIENITHLEAKNYDKVVCLQQGKFSSIFDLQPKDRTEFFVNIFNLENYDKVAKSIEQEVKANESNEKTLKNTLNEKLNSLYVSFSNEEDVKQSQFENEEFYEQYGEERQYNFTNLDKELKELKAKNEENTKKILETTKELNIAKDSQEKNQKELTKNEKIVEDFRLLEKAEEELKSTQEQKELIKEEVEKANYSKKILEILPTYNEIVQDEKEKQQKEIQCETAKKEHNICKTELKEYGDFNELVALRTKEIEQIKTEFKSLENFEARFLQLDFNKKAKKYNEDIKKYDEEIITINNEKDRVLKIYTKTKDEITTLTEKLEEATKELALLNERDNLAKYIVKLQEDKVCPLCGSTTHPNVVKALLEDEYKDKQVEIKRIEQSIEFSKVAFQKDIVSKYVVDKTYSDSFYANFEITVSNKTHEASINKKTATDSLARLCEERDILVKEYDAVFSGIKGSEYKKVLEAKIQDKQKELSDKKTKHDTLLKREKEIENQLTKFTERIRSLDETIKRNREKFDLFIKENGIQDFEVTIKTIYEKEKVEKILDKNKIISDNVLVLENRIKQLKNETKEYNFSELQVNIQKLKEIITKEKEIIAKCTQTQGGLKEKVRTFEVSFDSLNEKYNEYLEMVNTNKRVNVLNSIIGKRKFVEKLISLRTSMLVKNANKELSSITHAKYELDFNEKNEFVVRENKNGKVLNRSIKTLSGGENFIFSLCLSLALSKELQKNKNKAEFYFIDEGFGTLDDNMITEIFKVLTKVSSDVTIGLISHTPLMRSLVQRKVLIDEPNEKGIVTKKVIIE